MILRKLVRPDTRRSPQLSSREKRKRRRDEIPHTQCSTWMTIPRAISAEILYVYISCKYDIFTLGYLRAYVATYAIDSAIRCVFSLVCQCHCACFTVIVTIDLAEIIGSLVERPEFAKFGKTHDEVSGETRRTGAEAKVSRDCVQSYIEIVEKYPGRNRELPTVRHVS